MILRRVPAALEGSHGPHPGPTSAETAGQARDAPVPAETPGQTLRPHVPDEALSSASEALNSGLRAGGSP